MKTLKWLNVKKKTLLICELALEITECNNIMNCRLFHLLLYMYNDYKKPVEQILLLDISYHKTQILYFFSFLSFANRY